MAIYDAFISYSHANDKPIAAALQSVIQTLGKPWYRRRALRVFRDDTSLSATPHLWPSIEQALSQSRFLVLLASSEAAASPWVNREISYWLDNKSADTLLIAVTDGELTWDNAVGDFVWREGMPLPSVLSGRFVAEPKWVDLRGYRGGASLSDVRFTESSANFAAAIHGIPKDDLLSQEVRQQRRSLTLAWSAVGSLLILAAATAWQWNAAVKSERIAIAEAARAERNFSAAKDTIDGVIYDLVEGLKDVEGMRAETAHRILSRAEFAVGKLTTRTENDPAVLLSQAVMFGLFSDTYLRLGATEKAAESIQRSMGILRLLSSKHPDNSRFRIATSGTLGRFGAILVAQGDLKGALEAYREALGIQRALIGNHSGNIDLSIALNQVGDVLIAQGDLAGAFAAYSEGLNAIRAVSAGDPTNLLWRRSVFVSLIKNGDLLHAQGNLPGALDAYREGIDISRALSIKDPNNSQFRRDLTVGLIKVGHVLFSQDDLAAALSAHREGLEVARVLAASDKGNLVWQRGVPVFLDGLGRIRKAQGDFAEALTVYRESLDIRRSLGAKDATNTELQRDLSVSLNSLGDVYRAERNFEAAVVVSREALDVMRKLANADPSNSEWQIDLVFCLIMLASAGDDTRARFEEALTILNLLESNGRLPWRARGWIGMMETNLANLTNGSGGAPSPADARGMVE